MPRKTPGLLRRGRDPSPFASMRPRPDAAENEIRDLAAPHSGAASMRPRPDAAENDEAAWGDDLEAALLQ